MFKRAQRISPVDELSLSPLAKWIRYRIIPWDPILHILLLTVVIISISGPGTQSNTSYVENRMTFIDQFITPDLVDDPNDITNEKRSFELYKVENLLELLEFCNTNYYNLQINSPDQYTLMSPTDPLWFQIDDNESKDDDDDDDPFGPVVSSEEDDANIAPVLFIVESFKNGMDVYEKTSRSYAADLSIETTTYQIRQDDVLKPFSTMTDAEIVEFFALFHKAEIKMRFYGNRIESALQDDIVVPLIWDITLLLSTESHAGFIGVTVDAEFYIMADSQASKNGGLITVYIDIAIIAIIMPWVLLILRRIRRRAKLLYKARGFDYMGLVSTTTESEEELLLSVNTTEYIRLIEDEEEREREWKQVAKYLVVRDVSTFNIWDLLDFASVITLGMYAFSDLAEQFFINTKEQLNTTGSSLLLNTVQLHLLGGGTLSIATSLLQYFEYRGDWGMLIHTLKIGIPIVLRFLAGVAPLLIGYTLLGVAMFASICDRFHTFGAASVTLFSILNGDIMLEVFTQIYPASPIVSRIYLFSYVIIFVFIALNIFIQIMEQAFTTAMSRFGIDLGEGVEEIDENAELKQRLGISKESPSQMDALHMKLKQEEQETMEKLQRLKLLRILAMNRKERVNALHNMNGNVQVESSEPSDNEIARPNEVSNSFAREVNNIQKTTFKSVARLVTLMSRSNINNRNAKKEEEQAEVEETQPPFFGTDTMILDKVFGLEHEDEASNPTE
ncbi:hypothetical protein PCE1_000038 [Barthelona sp. PCE]